MIITLDPQTHAWASFLADERNRRKEEELGPNKDKLSKSLSDHDLRMMAVAGEWAAGLGLGCLFNPFYHRSGDGDRNDLTRAGLSFSLKTRYCTVRHPNYNVPHTARFQGLQDDFAILAQWTNRSLNQLRIIGWLPKWEFDRLKEQVIEHGKPTWIVRWQHFHPIEELVDYLDGLSDAEVDIAQTEGYYTYFKTREVELRAASEAEPWTDKEQKEWLAFVETHSNAHKNGYGRLSPAFVS